MDKDKYLSHLIRQALLLTSRKGGISHDDFETGIRSYLYKNSYWISNGDKEGIDPHSYPDRVWSSIILADMIEVSKGNIAKITAKGMTCLHFYNIQKNVLFFRVV